MWAFRSIDVHIYNPHRHCCSQTMIHRDASLTHIKSRTLCVIIISSFATHTHIHSPIDDGNEALDAEAMRGG